MLDLAGRMSVSRWARRRLDELMSPLVAELLGDVVGDVDVEAGVVRALLQAETGLVELDADLDRRLPPPAPSPPPPRRTRRGPVPATAAAATAAAIRRTSWCSSWLVGRFAVCVPVTFESCESAIGSARSVGEDLAEEVLGAVGLWRAVKNSSGVVLLDDLRRRP